ncbi:MAG: hypothetical protein ABR905_10330 [Terracidiphilus sp.]
MLDIHLPHGKLLGIKEFFLHLFTITIGLLIALSLEGWVESRHHRNLAREAEEGLRAEITNNANEVVRQRQMISDGQKKLEADLKILEDLRTHPHAKRGRIDLSIGMGGFDDLAWKNAQNTGALTFIPYEDAQSFSDIYTLQDVYFKTSMNSINDLGNATSLFASHPNDWVPSAAQIDTETDRIGKVQFDLVALSLVADQLDRTYQKFEAEHK